ncbi:adenosine deaminase [Salininema proteolyticum]|uniref:adenosine deaminase n=1 Tax=Salininema proteolyticum TaxID=1607685 RepID=A0ABV8TXW9_9ACTN
MTAQEKNPQEITLADIQQAPKVLLHDHLDGGLRPHTIVELADAIGHELPEHEPKDLARWFAESADSGSLERYLETFAHTCAVMQTADALKRVASEAAQDLAADGVVYAEIRYAPEQHQQNGLSLDEVVEAVQAGFAEGERLAAEAGHTIRIGTLLDAMRHADRSMEIAELAVNHRDRGVVGFDIAGGELGNPPEKHLEAFQYLKRESMPFTIHAGEADGLPSIWGAVQRCGCNRIGHGIRILDDIEVVNGELNLGDLADYIRDQRIALELCPSSNVQTGAAESVETHGIGELDRLGFRTTVNTDNRLMSNTTLSREFHLVATANGWGWEDIERQVVNAVKATFLHHPDKVELLREVVVPFFDAKK